MRLYNAPTNTFAQLIKSNNWLSVEKVLLALYPDQQKSIEGYEDVFNQLQNIAPKNSGIEIILTEQFDEGFDEEPYTIVSGKELNEDAGREAVGIEFVPWNEWLGMHIESTTQTNYTELEIIAHCLFEMTFIGFNEKGIQKEMKLLNEQVEELQNMSNEERKMNTRSLKEFLDELGNDEKNDT